MKVLFDFRGVLIQGTLKYNLEEKFSAILYAQFFSIDTFLVHGEFCVFFVERLDLTLTERSTFKHWYHLKIRCEVISLCRWFSFGLINSVLEDQ